MKAAFLPVFLLTFLAATGTCPAQLAVQVPANAHPQNLPTGVKPGMIRYVTQPNGWGKTKEEALKDLHNRIFPWYEKNFGTKPGFQIDWTWVAYVELNHKRCWQADGRVIWYAPPATPRSTARGPKMGKFNYGR